MSAIPGDIVLEPDERVLIATKPLALWLPAVILLIALWVLALWAFAAVDTAVFAAAALLAVAATVLLGSRWLRWRARWFVLTDRRVIVRQGVLDRRQSAILIQRMQDVTLERPFPLSLLRGYGILEIESAGGHSDERLAMEHADEFHRRLTDALTRG